MIFLSANAQSKSQRIFVHPAHWPAIVGLTNRFNPYLCFSAVYVICVVSLWAPSSWTDSSLILRTPVSPLGKTSGSRYSLLDLVIFQIWLWEWPVPIHRLRVCPRVSVIENVKNKGNKEVDIGRLWKQCYFSTRFQKVRRPTEASGAHVMRTDSNACCAFHMRVCFMLYTWSWSQGCRCWRYSYTNCTSHQIMI